MTAFANPDQALEIISGFLRRESRTDDRIFAGSGMILAYTISDLGARIVLDGRRVPKPDHAYDVYVNDPSAPEPSTEFIMDSETFDKVYRGEAQAMMLVMTGKVKTKGDVAGAMRLLPAMAKSIPHYKEYRVTH
jgi:putative sterol carrier protein